MSAIVKAAASKPLIENDKTSLSASVAEIVATDCWFSGTVKESLEVITGSLSLTFVIEISTSCDVVFRSSLKLTLNK